MANGNGDAARERFDQLEQMDKLLLRAQVLQQRALEILEETVSKHDAWHAEHQNLHDRLARESEARWQRIDTGLAEATDKINFLIDREMKREGGPEARG